MPDPTYPIPEVPAYKAAHIRAIQDEDFVSATQVVNPVVEAVLESIEYVHRQAENLAARVAVTLPAAGWEADQEGGVVLTLPVAGVTEDMVPTATLRPPALDAARACELCPVCETLPDGVRFWAKTAPAEGLDMELLLVLPGGGKPEVKPLGLPTAPEEDVGEMLEQVFGGGQPAGW